MENEIFGRRGLVILLVVGTIVIFVGVVWVIARYLPLDMLGIEKSTSTASRQLKENCTYPVTYWKEHPELFPPQIFIGGTAYQERELEALLSHDSLDPAEQLKTQLAVAFLNNWLGADQGTIEATIFDAYGWLRQHPPGSPVSEAEIAVGKQYLNELEAYNLGLAGVLPCNPTLSISQTGTHPTETTSEITATPSPSVTPTASLTATIISNTITPTRMPIPTTQRPRYPTDTPTEPLPHAPSNTPTTQAPSPTKTPIPPTPTFTPLPLPTDTYTPKPP